MADFEAWLVFLILVVNVVGELQRKKHLRHRAVSLRQHGFLVIIIIIIIGRLAGSLQPRPVLLTVLLLIAQALERAGPRGWAAGWLALAGSGLLKINLIIGNE